MNVYDPITEIKGVGSELAKKFAKLQVTTINDLVTYYPRKYQDYSNFVPINKLKPGLVTIRAKIKQVSGHYVRGGLHITEAVASDQTGSVRIVWFNQPYRSKAIKTDQAYFISGPFELKARRLSIMNPSMELVSAFPINTARMVPIYPEIKGLTSQAIRKTIKSALVHLKLSEVLPGEIVKANKLIARDTAIRQLHFPHDTKDIEQAKWSLGFEEVFSLITASLLNKRENTKEISVPIPFEKDLAQTFVKNLPYKLTDGQKRAVWQIYQDMAQKHPMNRLLEGDVGSGKTLVAAMAAIMSMKHGFQVALMAPTELLARQHADTLYALLKPLSYENSVTLLVGGMKGAQKQQARQYAKSGQSKLLVGTHALIQEKIDLHNLGLVIVDEQHRFGVEQRKKLLAKAGHMPHMLSMTATPIPRTLALTLYGEIDISILAEKPQNRKPIVTELIKPVQREKLYESIKQELKLGRQAFVVCPLIEANDILKDKSVQEVYKQIEKVFTGFRVGLLHGKLKPEEKQAVMQQFVEKQLDILVSTTVIEVGVDVPNATVMLIEAPERFGLAQIHQLRGRVGRSEHQGYCYLLLSDGNPPSKRLRAIAQSSDGFKLSELDLTLRGPGAIYGTYQHGELDLRVASLTNTKLIAVAREAAKKYVESGVDLLQYKELFERVTRLRSVVHLN